MVPGVKWARIVHHPHGLVVWFVVRPDTEGSSDPPSLCCVDGVVRVAPSQVEWQIISHTKAQVSVHKAKEAAQRVGEKKNLSEMCKTHFDDDEGLQKGKGMKLRRLLDIAKSEKPLEMRTKTTDQ
ncbi:hypothetical protein V2J09_020406 [Rumex salicifolius]